MPGDTMEQILDVMRKPFKELPDGVIVTPFAATNATAVSVAATPVAVKAAVTGKRHWITQAVFVNTVTADIPVLTLQDSDDTALFRTSPTNFADAPAQPMGPLTVEFDPPIPVAAGKAIELAVHDDVGQNYVSINGYVEV